MKLKSDFVTNSSSCSFIFIGWTFPQNIKSAAKIAKVLGVEYNREDEVIENLKNIDAQSNVNILFGRSNEDGLKENTIYVGHYTKINNEDSVDEDLSIIEAINNDKIIDVFQLSNLKVIFGTMVC